MTTATAVTYCNATLHDGLEEHVCTMRANIVHDFHVCDCGEVW